MQPQAGIYTARHHALFVSCLSRGSGYGLSAATYANWTASSTYTCGYLKLDYRPGRPATTSPNQVLRDSQTASSDS